MPDKDQYEKKLSDLQQQLGEMQALNAFCTGILDSMPCKLIVIDSQMNILKCNNHVQALSGNGNLVGKKLNAALSYYDAPQIKNAIQETFKDRQYRTFELPDDEGKSTIHYFAPLHENSGIDSIMVLSCPAIVKTSDENRSHMREKFASLGAFAGKIAHDINNPLSVIITRMDYLQSIDLENAIEEGDVVIGEEVSIINRQALRIYDILDKAGAMQMQGKEIPVEADITEIVTRAVTIAEFQRPYKTVHAEKVLPTGFPQLICHEIKLERAIKEVMTNAFEAVGEKGNVKIELSFQDPWYKITVTDDGVGIAQENLGRVFDPFVSTKQGVKGAGLGLTIAYGAALAHDGDIQLQSRQGSGTTLTMLLKTLEL